MFTNPMWPRWPLAGGAVEILLTCPKGYADVHSWEENETQDTDCVTLESMKCLHPVTAGRVTK